MPPQGIPSHNGDEEIVARITNVNPATKTIQFCAQTPPLAVSSRLRGRSLLSWIPDCP